MGTHGDAWGHSKRGASSQRGTCVPTPGVPMGAFHRSLGCMGTRHGSTGTPGGHGATPACPCPPRVPLPAARCPSRAGRGRSPAPAGPWPGWAPSTSPPHRWHCRSPAGTAGVTPAPTLSPRPLRGCSPTGSTRSPRGWASPAPWPPARPPPCAPAGGCRCGVPRLWVGAFPAGRRRGHPQPPQHPPDGCCPPLVSHLLGIEVGRLGAADATLGAQLQQVEQDAAIDLSGDVEAQGDVGDGGRALIVELGEDSEVAVGDTWPQVAPLGAAPYLVDVLHADAVVLQPAAALRPMPARGQHHGGGQGFPGGISGVSVTPRHPGVPLPCPTDPHPRSSIAACASTGTATVTTALVGLFLLRGHGGESGQGDTAPPTAPPKVWGCAEHGHKQPGHSVTS